VHWHHALFLYGFPAVNNPTIDATRHDELSELLEPLGQSHLLQFWDELSGEQRNNLANQIRSVDWETFSMLTADQGSAPKWLEIAERAESPPAITLEQFREPVSRAQAVRQGSMAIASGQVAFVLTAGGQGSRLGFEHPKGMLPIGPVSGRTLFQVLIEHAQARSNQFGSRIPIYIMTSPQTDRETNTFLSTHDWFGYPSEDIRTFCQGVIPAVDIQTKLVLLESKDRMFVNPDGHGGALAALVRSGSIEDMRRRGIKHVFYGQVDNPLLQVCDPALIGNHLLHQSEMTTQVIRKREPLQKVGNVVQVDGRVQIIEYSDLPEAAARQTSADGGLKLWAGSIAVHVFDLEFFTRCNLSPQSLPFHQALKKVDCIDASGKLHRPLTANAIKFERFIFDLLPLAQRAIVCEVDPAEGFAAVKNAEPALTETPGWVQKAMICLHTSWLEKAGALIAPGTPIEINPAFALDAEQVSRRILTGQKFDQPTYLC
jgi:UDP-N-acetylglucosamine/UDP-N-acetylgalactosamine diphosphorylase